MFYIQFNEVVSIGNHGMMGWDDVLFICVYTHMENQTKEHQHKNTFKAVNGLYIKDGWMDQYPFQILSVMFSFVFLYILKQQYSQICKIFYLD